MNDAKSVSEKMFPECIHRSLVYFIHNFNYQSYYFQCFDNLNEFNFKVCDAKPDCLDGSDEFDCDCNAAGMQECNHHSKTKLDTRRCYSNSHQCDGMFL